MRTCTSSISSPSGMGVLLRRWLNRCHSGISRSSLQVLPAQPAKSSSLAASQVRMSKFRARARASAVSLVRSSGLAYTAWYGTGACASSSAWRRPLALRCTPGSRPVMVLPIVSVSPCRMNQNVVVIAENFLIVRFDLGGSLHQRMFRHDARARRFADGAPLGIGHVAEIAQGVLRRFRDQNLLAEVEDAVETRPVVAHNRSPAGGRFEQAHTRRIAGGDHEGPGDVQGEPLLSIKLAMQLRLEMKDAADVLRPANRRRVSRAGDGEAPLRPAAGGLDQKPVERGLAVVAIGPEITEIPTLLDRLGIVEPGINRTVESARHRRAEAGFDAPQSGTAGEREIEMITADEGGRNIIG